jgi:hypothetical protein
MADPQQAIQILEELQRELQKKTIAFTSQRAYYAVRGPVEDALNALKLDQAEEKREKRETNALENTRQPETQATPETPSKGKSNRKKKKKKKEAKQTPTPPKKITENSESQQTTSELGATKAHGGQAEPQRDPEQLELEKPWTTVASRANKANPGDVNLKHKSKEGSLPNATAKSTPSRKSARSSHSGTSRTGGVVRFRINKESEWTTKYGKSPEELVDEIAEAAGENIARLIVGIAVYRGGDVKIQPTPYARDTLKDLTWIRKWAPSAVPPKKEYELLITRVPVTGTAEEVAEAIIKENYNHYFGQQLQISRATWKERNYTDLKTASLRITVPTMELADRLILNGVGIRRKFFRVRKFIKRFDPEREYAPLFGRTGEGYTPPTSDNDPRMSEEEVVFSSSSETTQNQDQPTKRKMPDNTLPARKTQRGRPPGALNKSKFESEPRQGENPFQITKRKTQEVANSQDPKEKEVLEVPDTQMSL